TGSAVNRSSAGLPAVLHRGVTASRSPESHFRAPQGQSGHIFIRFGPFRFPAAARPAECASWDLSLSSRSGSWPGRRAATGQAVGERSYVLGPDTAAAADEPRPAVGPGDRLLE